MNMSVSYTLDRASSKKNIILQTAHRLFSEQCFGRAGIDRIIEESAVAKMTFYRHFKSKEQLIEACLEFEIENQISSINAACSQSHITSPIEKLQALYLWFIDRALDLDNRSYSAKTVMVLQSCPPDLNRLTASCVCIPIASFKSFMFVTLWPKGSR
ncbi:hypothetical protein VNO77_49228 [Canavalia gladiata]|uniref:HTH tetR-type domain-containing protein n=1 Tax=Canavalia gladiata TaxID=3824 RepID=A0AAN9PH91_CANGL